MARFLALIFLVCVTGIASGCVDRKVRIETDPAEAEVFLDGVSYGMTPVDIPFEFYGVREIRLEKEGYQTVTMRHKFSAPIYQWFPLDFVSENVIPFTFKDDHLLHIELQERKPLSLDEKDQLADEVEKRAKTLRAQLDQED